MWNIKLVFYKKKMKYKILSADINHYSDNKLSNESYAEF